jgi:ABC-type sugar transport system ATPase subunit
VHHSDAGPIFFEGREVHFSRPIEARQAGIETIYQDLALAGNLDVSANIFLGREVKKRYLLGAVKTLDDKTMRGAGCHPATARHRYPDAPGDELSGGQRQAGHRPRHPGTRA